MSLGTEGPNSGDRGGNVLCLNLKGERGITG